MRHINNALEYKYFSVINIRKIFINILYIRFILFLRDAIY